MWLFQPDVWLDRWTLVHLLTGVIVWYLVQHYNHQNMNKITNHRHEMMAKEVEEKVANLPQKRQENIDLSVFKKPLTLRFDLSTVLLCAYFWEALEHYFELWYIWPGFSSLIEWQEHWFNRLILDPLMLIVWYIAIRFFPKLFWPSTILCGALVLVLVW